MKLDKNSWHARFWCKAYDESYNFLPTNLCSYFWDIVWAIVWLPFTWWTYFWDSVDYHVERIKYGALGTYIIMMLGMMGDGIAKTKFNQGGVWSFIWGIPIGAAIFCLVLAVIASLVFTVRFAIRNTIDKPKKIKQQKSPNILSEYIKAKKKKLCPIITWEDQKESAELSGNKDSQ